MPEISISKVLSANDVKATGCHQSGILIPKTDETILSFFPTLAINEVNPRAELEFVDQIGNRWNLIFICYNQRRGRTAEYRLTRTILYIKQNRLNAGDMVILSKTSDGTYMIRFRRNGDADDEGDSGDKGDPDDQGKNENNAPNKVQRTKTVLTPGNGWKRIKF